MAEEVDALLKEIRKKNAAKRRAMMMREAQCDLSTLRAGNSRHANGLQGRSNGLFNDLDRIFTTKREAKKQDFEEIASRIKGKK